MKRKTTKEILAESFRELAESRSIDKITVQEIVDNCGYSTATFYRHFKDKYDLIAWGYAHKAEEIMAQLSGNNTRWKQTLMDWAAYFISVSSIFRLAVAAVMLPITVGNSFASY